MAGPVLPPVNPPVGWQTKPGVKLPAGTIPSQRRVDFRVEDFDLFIKQKGIRVKVFRTLLCPNVKSIDGGEHQVDCKVCFGTQFIDLSPIETIAMVQMDENKRKQEAEGESDVNTIKMSFARGIELQYFTLVELLDFTDIFFERVKRQRGQIDVLKYRACCVNVLVDSKGKQYYQGQDFTLDPNGSIRWGEDKGPLAEDIYSVHYNMKKQYRAIKAEHVDRYTQVQQNAQGAIIEMVKLPEQWLLQKEYFVERKDIRGGQLAPNLIRDEDQE